VLLVILAHLYLCNESTEILSATDILVKILFATLQINPAK
jgi:hypothetical protein